MKGEGNEMKEERRVANKNHEQFINANKGKTAEQLLEMLWRAKLDAQGNRWREQTATDYIKRAQPLLETIKKENDCLRRVLEENGIRPVRVRLHYTVRDCENCEYNEQDINEDGTVCFDSAWVYHDCPMRKEVVSCGFYCYSISDGEFDGIGSDFTDHGYTLLKVVDERTGETIWERKSE